MLTSGAILFFVCAFAATLPLPQQRPAFKAATELVEVDAGPPAEYSASWFGALQELARANVSLYYLNPHGLVYEGPSIADGIAPSPSGSIGGGVSEAFDHRITFATESGGAAFVNSNFFDRAIEQVWRETGDYYLLGYEPAGSDHALHKIAVEVHRRGVQVRARKTR